MLVAHCPSNSLQQRPRSHSLRNQHSWDTYGQDLCMCWSNVSAVFKIDDADGCCVSVYTDPGESSNDGTIYSWSSLDVRVLHPLRSDRIHMLYLMEVTAGTLITHKSALCSSQLQGYSFPTPSIVPYYALSNDFVKVRVSNVSTRTVTIQHRAI